MALPACTRDAKAGFSALNAAVEAAEFDFMQCSAASMTCRSFPPSVFFKHGSAIMQGVADDLWPFSLPTT